MKVKQSIVRTVCLLVALTFVLSLFSCASNGKIKGKWNENYENGATITNVYWEFDGRGKFKRISDTRSGTRKGVYEVMSSEKVWLKYDDEDIGHIYIYIINGNHLEFDDLDGYGRYGFTKKK